MPHVPRQFRQVPVALPKQHDIEPMDVAPLTSPNRKIPEPRLPDIPELPMTLAPAAPERRPQVPAKEAAKPRRRGLAQLSVKKWDIHPNEIGTLLGLE